MKCFNYFYFLLKQADNEKLVDGLFEEDQIEQDPILNIPMVSPDANFVNMLRYSMLALSLLPEHSISSKSSLFNIAFYFFN